MKTKTHSYKKHAAEHKAQDTLFMTNCKVEHPHLRISMHSSGYFVFSRIDAVNIFDKIKVSDRFKHAGTCFFTNSDFPLERKIS